jgi:glyoxylase-like metal-dependent hydrolase (beta-lactamase superfamily II)
MRFLLALVVVVASVSACDPEVRTYEREGVSIHHLVVGIGNVWALEGDGGTVLVDLSEKGDLPEIERGLELVGIGLADIRLVVLTHGHLDHLGPAAALQEELDAPIALGAADVEFAEAGFSEPPESQIPEGELVRPILDKSFPAFTPDVLLGTELDLHAFGVPGRVIGTPGHTKGSVSVLLESGDVFCGDLVRGTGEGNVGVDDHQGIATTHYFSADPRGDSAALEGLVNDGGAVFYPGHGPFFDVDSLDGWLVDRKDELDAPGY